MAYVNIDVEEFVRENEAEVQDVMCEDCDYYHDHFNNPLEAENHFAQIQDLISHRDYSLKEAVESVFGERLMGVE